MTFRMSLLALIACGGAATDAHGPKFADLDAAAALVHPMQPLADAEKAVKEKLGEPKTNDPAANVWYAQEGDKCKMLTVSKMGDSVGGAVVTDAPCPGAH